MARSDDPNALFQRFCALDFYDPNAGDLKTHDGRNKRIAERLVNREAEFHNLVFKVKNFLKKNNADKYEISFWCNRGRHRSVACAMLFARILAREYHVDRVTHKSLVRHRYRQCSCWQCNKEEFPEALIERAEGVWQQAERVWKPRRTTDALLTPEPVR